MNTKSFQTGQWVTFRYGTRLVRGVIKENRGPIGMKGRVLYLVEFRPEDQSSYMSHIELPADQLTGVEGTVSVN